MLVCNKCGDNKDIEFYNKKEWINITFFNTNLCKACYFDEESMYNNYRCYTLRVTRFAQINCPEYLKNQFIISIQFESIKE